MKRLIQGVALLLTATAHAGLIDLELPLLAPDTHRENWGPAGGFSSGGATFNNYYDSTFGSWAGFALSNENDAVTPGFGNQYSAVAGSGAGGSAQFGVGYQDFYNNIQPTITLPIGEAISSLWITNTTYAVSGMTSASPYNKKFGGETGNDPDYFRLTISGYDASNALTATREYYLADYRFADNSQDYIVNDWRLVDLSDFSASTRALAFSFESSDADENGIRTPTYVAVDRITTVPEPGSALLLALAATAIAARRRRG